MRNILFLGATGTAGSFMVRNISEQTDYKVTAFARHASDVYQENDRLRVIDGDAMNLAELIEAMQGQDVVYCAISGDNLPQVAKNIVDAMHASQVKRLIFMGAVGIYNDIPAEIDGNDNVAINPDQIPNRDAVSVIEESDLDYTILRPGYLQNGNEDDFVLSFKNEKSKGYTTSLPALTNFAIRLMGDDTLLVGESVGFTRDMTKRCENFAKQKVTLNNGIEMPLLGFGTFLMAEDTCEESVLTALKAGVRLIDTAAAYGNEQYVGTAIKKSGIPREEIFVVSKINFDSYEDAGKAVADSLDRLGLDYVDLMLLHWPFGNYYAAWRALEKAYKAGKCRAIGVSNFDSDRLIDLIKFNEITPAVNQIETNVFVQRKEENVWMEKYGVTHMAYAPLGQGYRNEMFDLREVQFLAEKYSKTAAQILLRYQLQRGIVVIPKSTHEDHICENFNVFDFTLTVKEMDDLAELDRMTPQIGDPENPEKVEIAMTWIGK